MHFFLHFFIFFIFLASWVSARPGPDDETKAQVTQALNYWNSLDPCVREFVQYAVLDQGSYQAHDHFQQLSVMLKGLELPFDTIEQKMTPLTISADLTHYTALSEVLVTHGELETRFFSIETRVGVPKELPLLLEKDGQRIWPREATGEYQNVLSNEHHMTMGVGRLMRFHLDSWGLGPRIDQAIAEISAQTSKKIGGLLGICLVFMRSKSNAGSFHPP